MLRQGLMYQARLNSLCNWDGLNSYPSTSQCTSRQEASITFNHQTLQSLSVWDSASVLHVSELAAWADPKQSLSLGSVSCFLWITLRSGHVDKNNTKKEAVPGSGGCDANPLCQHRWPRIGTRWECRASVRSPPSAPTVTRLVSHWGDSRSSAPSSAWQFHCQCPQGGCHFWTPG